VSDLAAIERELDVARERDDNTARVRLIPRALELTETQRHRAEYLDELAYAYQQLGRFDEAVDAMRQAVAAGWDGDLDEHPSAQALIADLLLHAEHTDQADIAWLHAEREDPSNPWLHQTAGLAYADVGLHSKALPWQTKGLTLALATNVDSDMLWMLTSERAETLDALGQPPDELQLRAEELVDREEQAEQARVDAFYRDQSARTVPPERVGRSCLVPSPGVPAGARDLAKLRRGLRARPLRRVLRPTRTAPTTTQSPRRRAARARTNHDRRLPPLVRRERPRSRAIRDPRELRHRTPQNNHDASLATRAQPALLVRKRTQVQEVLPTRQLTPHIGLRHPHPATSKNPKLEPNT